MGSFRSDGTTDNAAPSLDAIATREPLPITAKAVEERAAILKALEQLGALPPGWNGYGACPVDRGVIETAKEFILSVPSEMLGSPKVVPMTRGRLQFEWHRGNRSLELEFESSDRIHYLKWDPGTEIEDEDVIPVREVGRIHALLRWFEGEPGNG
jgi:hypothetical protein